MISKFESVRVHSLDQNKGEPELSESVFPEPLEKPNETSAPLQKATFKPTSVDLDDFIKTEWIGRGLLREDLQEISQTAGSEGNTRRQQLADFLVNHFDDVSNLSASGTEKISMGDLGLYQQLLRANELNDKPDLNAWQKLHYEHETKPDLLLPVAGGLAGHWVNMTARTALLRIPAVQKGLLGFMIANPRTAVAAGVADLVVGLAAPIYAGYKGGQALNGTLKGEGATRHFYDEAAPAMKRLMEG